MANSPTYVSCSLKKQTKKKKQTVKKKNYDAQPFQKSIQF